MDGRIFGLDAQLIFDACVLAINIFLLFILLSYLLFNPVRAVLKKRQDRITETREQANKDKADANALKEEYTKKLANVEKEAESILSEARKKGLSNQERIINEAKAEAAKIVEFAKQEAELEKKKVADEVKQEIIKVATIMANKVVAANIDESKQEELINDTLREIGDSTWLS
ncbi:MAG: F0F1 ATP synthase subunit B [Lachnospiraceae bacterium]|nr:F0F1 ATP synthase subunit B [Lachnospiraceae bacterium]